jgi:hypothetical protein
MCYRYALHKGAGCAGSNSDGLGQTRVWRIGGVGRLLLAPVSAAVSTICPPLNDLRALVANANGRCGVWLAARITAAYGPH